MADRNFCVHGKLAARTPAAAAAEIAGARGPGVKSSWTVDTVCSTIGNKFFQLRVSCTDYESERLVQVFNLSSIKEIRRIEN